MNMLSDWHVQDDIHLPTGVLSRTPVVTNLCLRSPSTPVVLRVSNTGAAFNRSTVFSVMHVTVLEKELLQIPLCHLKNLQMNH